MAAASTETPPEKLEKEVEQTRAQVAETLEELQSRVSETVADWRGRLSPDEIKQEAKAYVMQFKDEALDYVRSAGRQAAANVAKNLAEKARENPIQALAIGALAAWPVIRMARAVPLPVYLIGAGALLARPLGAAPASSPHAPPSHGTGTAASGLGETVSHAARAAAQSVSEAVGAVREGVRSAAERLREGGEAVGATLSDTAERVFATASDAVDRTASDVPRAAAATLHGARDATASAVSSLGAVAQDVAGRTVEKARELGDAASATLRAVAEDAAARAARMAPRIPREFDETQTLILGALGLAVGAAAALRPPPTQAEAVLFGALRDEAIHVVERSTGVPLEKARALAEAAYLKARREAEAYGLVPDEIARRAGAAEPKPERGGQA